ncbi:hypothetical protein DSO57_1016367 [Entomophthora muscae]|uniref:Uncharacterized protein n=1 Tax=Entomophthora muscae TaxID=34485 RepID=A0ACC2URI7_9FUNG|nr:hypothetical protein DSO57_1016367 [Entomophthora muscae]
MKTTPSQSLAMTQDTLWGLCWKRIEGFPVKNAQFNEDFSPRIGENKNQTEEKMELNKHHNNLSSRQAPAAIAQVHATPASTLCQPPAPRQLPAGLPPSQLPASPLPASHPPARPQPATRLPTQPPAGLPPGSQPSLSRQSENSTQCSQSNKSLEKGKKLENNSWSPEEGQTQVLKENSNSTQNQWDPQPQVTWLRPNPNQKNPPKTKIDFGNLMNCHHHLITCPEDIIGSSQEWLNPQQIVKEQEFGHLLKPQFPIPFSKLLGSPTPCFHSHFQKFAQWEAL